MKEGAGAPTLDRSAGKGGGLALDPLAREEGEGGQQPDPVGSRMSHQDLVGIRVVCRRAEVRGAQAHGRDDGGRRRGWCGRSRAGSWLGRWGRREIPQEWGRARGVPHSGVAAGVGTVLLLVR
jgi:hypothetical protein